MMAHPGHTADYLNLTPPEFLFCEKCENADFHTFRAEILAISTRSSRPDVPILNPETHCCGLRVG
jgi:hypothetical protein